MIPALQTLLAEKDVKDLHQLMDLIYPGAEPAEGQKTVQVRGALVAKDAKSIGVQIGNMVLQIPINAVANAKKDPSPPSVPVQSAISVILDISDTSSILIFRLVTAKFVAAASTQLPFVLNKPSQSKTYSVSSAQLESQQTERDKKLNVSNGNKTQDIATNATADAPSDPSDDPWTIPSIGQTPSAPAPPSTAATNAGETSSSSYTTSYDSKVDTTNSSPYTTVSGQGTFATTSTDYNSDAITDVSTDLSGDHLEGTGQVTWTNTQYDSRSTTSTDSPYTTQSAQGSTSTDSQADYSTSTSTDFGQTPSYPNAG